MALNAHQQFLTYVSFVIGGCINFNVCFNLNFLHVRREANQVTHYLAKYALIIKIVCGLNKLHLVFLMC